MIKSVFKWRRGDFVGFPTNPVGVELFSYVSAFLVPTMATWVKTLYKPAIFVFIYFLRHWVLIWPEVDPALFPLSRPALSTNHELSIRWFSMFLHSHVNYMLLFFIPSTALTRLTLARGDQSCSEATKAVKLKFKKWMSVIVKSWLPRKS